MRKIKTILLIGLMTLLLSPLSLAQDFDANRMNRDIKIMENILGELFKTQITSTKGTPSVRVNELVFLGNRSSSNVSGTYIPGYGVIFMIPPANNRSVVISRTGGEAEISFQYSSGKDESDKTVDEESVTNRINEFLQNYASSIGQLKPEEQVLVIYGTNSSNRNNRFVVYNIRGGITNDKEATPQPIISVSAKKSDLEAYRSGRLNADAFQNRLSISKTEDKEYLDLKVLGNIFNTALGDGDGTEFHLVNSNSLSYLYLENFGAIYTLNLHRGHALGGFRAKLAPTPPPPSMTSDERSFEDLKKTLQEEEKELQSTLESEFDALVKRTKEYIIDYGRTLSSLTNDQYLMVSLNITDANNYVPERVDFQIQKSILNQLDRGQISRENALKAVTITEY